MTKNFKNIPTDKEVKEKITKIAENGGIVMPSHADFPIAVEGSDKGEFTHATISGMGFYEDEIGIDGNGDSHTFHGGMYIKFNWAIKGFGFGEFSIKKRSDGVIEIDTEMLGKDFAKDLLSRIIDNSVDTSEKHREAFKKATKQ